MPQLSFVILPLLLVVVFVFTKNDVRDYERFKLLKDSNERCLALRRWVIQSFLLFGCGAIVSLLAIGHAGNLVEPLREFSALVPVDESPKLNNVEEADSEILENILGAIVGLGIVCGILWGLSRLERRKRDKSGASEIAAKKESSLKTIGDIESLIPRNRQERFWVTLLSLNAGFSEELFFRVLLPILLFTVTGNAIVSIAISLLCFGAVHWYQGWTGVLATTAFGGLMMAVYLASGSLLLAMAAHAALDLNGLIVMPALHRWSDSKPAHPELSNTSDENT